MSKLVWDKVGERLYETGIDHGVLSLLSNNGTYQSPIPWNGLTAVSESSSGAEATGYYADNIKYLNLLSAEEFGATIEAYAFPEDFNKCIGRLSLANGVYVSGQKRCHFGLSYRTIVGNDTESNDYSYKLHLIFNCLASTSEESHNTVNDSPEPMTYSWEITANTVSIKNHKASAVLTIDAKKFYKFGMLNALNEIENRLYGTDASKPSFPSAADVLEIIDKEIYLTDSSGDYILDSNGKKIQSFVYV